MLHFPQNPPLVQFFGRGCNHWIKGWSRDQVLFMRQFNMSPWKLLEQNYTTFSSLDNYPGSESEAEQMMANWTAKDQANYFVC